VVSGYAGRRSVAISYVDHPAAAPHLVAALRPWLPILMLLHEQTHQLGVAHPAWLSESLAQHYALEALGRSGALPAADFRKARDRVTRPWSLTPEADSRVRLLAAHRRYLRTGSLEAYRIFYTNGARFWHVVDRAISACSHGRRGLDTIVRQLLRLRYDRQGRPPAAFHRLLRQEGGAAARRAIARWVIAAP
jgi:predicted metalloprotease with PDZ domain